MFLKVACHSALSPRLDLVPGQHMVAFTKRAVIKAQLSKTKLLIMDFFPPPRSIFLQKNLFQPQVKQCFNTYDNIQPPSHFGGDVGPFYLIHFLHRPSDIISVMLQWFPLIYFSTMGPKLFLRWGRLHLLSQDCARCMFQKHISCIPSNKIHCKTNSDVGLYTHLRVYYAQTYAGRHKVLRLRRSQCNFGLCRAVLASRDCLHRYKLRRQIVNWMQTDSCRASRWCRFSVCTSEKITKINWWKMEAVWTNHWRMIFFATLHIVNNYSNLHLCLNGVRVTETFHSQ